MASTYTQNTGIEKIGVGEQNNTWGTTVNLNQDIIDRALGGQVRVTLTATGSSGTPNEINISDGALSDGQFAWIEIYSASDLGGTCYVRLNPNDAQRIIFFKNSLAGTSRSVYVFQGTYNASNIYDLRGGETAALRFDGAGSGAVVYSLTDAILDRPEFKSISFGRANMSDSAFPLISSSSVLAIQAAGYMAVCSPFEVVFNDSDWGSGNIMLRMKSSVTYGNSSVEMYYDTTKVFETVSGGTKATGTLQVTGALTAGDGVIGQGQTWQNLAGSRTAGVSYQNTTGTPIEVRGQFAAGASRIFQTSSNGSTWISLAQSDGTVLIPFGAVVPNNHYYRVSGSAMSWTYWAELR